jgi:hypothetical protein
VVGSIFFSLTARSRTFLEKTETSATAVQSTESSINVVVPLDDGVFISCEVEYGIPDRSAAFSVASLR